MAEREQPNLQLKHPASVRTRVLQGTGIGAILIGFTFTLGMNNNPEDFRSVILPLLFVPAAGALGGLVYYVTEPMRALGGSKKIIANLISGLAFLLFVTVAFILGMNSPH